MSLTRTYFLRCLRANDNQLIKVAHMCFNTHIIIYIYMINCQILPLHSIWHGKSFINISINDFLHSFFSFFHIQQIEWHINHTQMHFKISLMDLKRYFFAHFWRANVNRFNHTIHSSADCYKYMFVFTAIKCSLFSPLIVSSFSMFVEKHWMYVDSFVHWLEFNERNYASTHADSQFVCFFLTFCIFTIHFVFRAPIIIKCLWKSHQLTYFEKCVISFCEIAFFNKSMIVWRCVHSMLFVRRFFFFGFTWKRFAFEVSLFSSKSSKMKFH